MKTKARTRRKDRKLQRPVCSKFAFEDVADANDHAIEAEDRTGERMRVYWCQDHQGYHVTHRR